jgi:hypothetical protein
MQRNFWPRILLILSTYIYALSLIYAHEAYLNPVWGYFGFRFSSPTTLHYLMGLLLLTVTASSMPLYTNSCSSMIMTLFYSIVFVPTITVTLCLRPDSLDRYSVLLIVMTIGFSMVAALLKQVTPRPGGSAGLPSDTAEVVVIILWIIMAGALVFAFSDMMTLASLTDVYGQRFAARDARIPILAYILAYFSYIVCPTLLARLYGRGSANGFSITSGHDFVLCFLRRKSEDIQAFILVPCRFDCSDGIQRSKRIFQHCR